MGRQLFYLLPCPRVLYITARTNWNWPEIIWTKVIRKMLRSKIARMIVESEFLPNHFAIALQLDRLPVLENRPEVRFKGLGGKYFCFYYMFKRNFSGHKTFWGHKSWEGTAGECPSWLRACWKTRFLFGNLILGCETLKQFLLCVQVAKTNLETDFWFRQQMPEDEQRFTYLPRFDDLYSVYPC